MVRKFVIALAVLTLVGTSASAWAKTSPHTGGSGGTLYVAPYYSDGGCPGPQFQTINAAIYCAEQANGGFTIVVAQGTYYENVIFGQNCPSNFGSTQDNITLAGGGPGVSIIDGGAASSTVAVNPAQCEMQSVVTISGFTITDGGNYEGGGVLNGVGSQLTLKNDVITNNGAYDGGGVWNSPFAQLNLTGSTVSNNGANYGGGIFNGSDFGEGCFWSDFPCIASQVNIKNSTVSNNWAESDGGGLLASIFGSVSASYSTFSNNTAGGDGGGLAMEFINQAALSHVMITGNTGFSGGGIYNETSHMSINNSSKISSNHADPSSGDGGGVLNTYGAAATLSASSVGGNTAGFVGGGLANCGNSQLALNNSSVNGNTAGYDGGGIANDPGDTYNAPSSYTLYKTPVNSNLPDNTATVSCYLA